MEILSDEWKVLNTLFHPELFETVVVETSLPVAVAKDILLTLVHHRYVFVETESGKRLRIFDKDLLYEVKFSLTSKGLKAWEVYNKKKKP